MQLKPCARRRWGSDRCEEIHAGIYESHDNNSKENARLTPFPWCKISFQLARLFTYAFFRVVGVGVQVALESRLNEAMEEVARVEQALAESVSCSMSAAETAEVRNVLHKHCVSRYVACFDYDNASYATVSCYFWAMCVPQLSVPSACYVDIVSIKQSVLLLQWWCLQVRARYMWLQQDQPGWRGRDVTVRHDV